MSSLSKITGIISSIGSLAKAVKSEPTTTFQKALVGTVKAPVTAPVAIGKTFKEKPLSSVGIAAIFTFVGNYMGVEKDISVVELLEEYAPVVIDAYNFLGGMF
jgi:hypothetical protein